MNKTTAIFLAALATVSVRAATLTVNTGVTTNITGTGSSLSFDQITVNGTLNLSGVGLLSKVGGSSTSAYIILGNTSGAQAIVNLSGNGKFTALSTQSDSTTYINVGAATSGGSGKFIISGDWTEVPFTASAAGATELYNNYYYSKYKTTSTKMLMANRRLRTVVMKGAASNDLYDGKRVITLYELNRGGVCGAITYNNSSYPVLVKFNGGLMLKNNISDTHFKNKGDYILQSVNGNPIHIHDWWSSFPLNDVGTSVTTCGDGDFYFSARDNAAAIMTLNSGVVFNHKGDTIVTNRASIITTADELLPHAQDAGSLRICGFTSGADRYGALITRGHSSHINGLLTYNGAYVSNDVSVLSTFTIGEYVTNCAFSARCIGDVSLTKRGDGELKIADTTLKDFFIESGCVHFTGYNEFDSVTWAPNTWYATGGNALDFSLADIGGYGAPEIRKEGDSELAFSASGSGSPILRILSGTAKVVAGETKDTFWRLTLKRAAYDAAEMQIGGILFTDAGGNYLFNSDTAFKSAGSGSYPATLGPGYASITRGYKFKIGKIDDVTYGLPKMFSTTETTAMCWTNGTARLDDDTTWKQVAFRLPTGCNPTAGYRIMSIPSETTAFPVAWTLESSPTGEDGSWKVMDERTLDADTVKAERAARSGAFLRTQQFAFEGSDAIATAFFTNAARVVVSKGAKLDLTALPDDHVLFNGLETSYDSDTKAMAENGEITFFRPAQNGSLYLTNMPNDLTLDEFIVPFTFTRVASDEEMQNVKTWLLYVNGALNSHYEILPDPKGFRIHRRRGSSLIYW